MLPLLLLCIAGSVLAQQSTTQTSTTNSQVESEGNTQTYLYPIDQTYNNLQPAAQQRRPTYTAPRAPESYSYMPYSFNYVSNMEDGSSSRQETGDSSGRVVGSYTLAVEDGRRRVVDYIADQNGFRATIDTNEPGTEAQSPADVQFYSAATGRSNPPQTSYRPYNSYRPRPSTIYSQPNVLSPVYHRDDVHAPYRHYDNHAWDRYGHNGHNGHAYSSYYDNNNYRHYWH
uniref:Cuticle protein 10.9 n=1 Tax=Parasteatoda tepidariorum TaxID=114398 RepID=A0A2L2Y4K2_PARTP